VGIVAEPSMCFQPQEVCPLSHNPNRQPLAAMPPQGLQQLRIGQQREQPTDRPEVGAVIEAVPGEEGLGGGDVHPCLLSAGIPCRSGRCNPVAA